MRPTDGARHRPVQAAAPAGAGHRQLRTGAGRRDARAAAQRGRRGLPPVRVRRARPARTTSSRCATPSRPYPQERAFAELLRHGRAEARGLAGRPTSWKTEATDRAAPRDLHPRLVRPRQVGPLALRPVRRAPARDAADPGHLAGGGRRPSPRRGTSRWCSARAGSATRRCTPAFEEGPVGAEICEHAVRRARDLGAWGTVVCSNAAPHHPMWQDVRAAAPTERRVPGEPLSMWTIAGCQHRVHRRRVGDRVDLVAWGPHGVSDGPSPFAFHGQVQYLLPGTWPRSSTRRTACARSSAPTSPSPGQALTWRLMSTSSTTDGLQASFADDVTGLRVELRWRFAAGHRRGRAVGGCAQRGRRPGHAHPARLGRVLRARPPSELTLSYLCGQWAQEFTPASTCAAARALRDRQRSGRDRAPVRALPRGRTTVTRSTGWGWPGPGSWHITADADAAGLTRVRAGRALDGAPVTLAPGDSVTTPVAAGVYSADGLDGLARQWHAYERLARTRPDPRKVIYNSWEATTFDVTAAGQLALADVAASLGVETFVVDDGWFVGRHDDRGGLGDWTPDPAKFPDGFDAFAAAIRERGMELRAVGRAGDGQPEVGPLRRSSRVGLPGGRAAAQHDPQPVPAEPRAGRRVRVRPGHLGRTAFRVRDPVFEVGLQPPAHGGRPRPPPTWTARTCTTSTGSSTTCDATIRT